MPHVQDIMDTSLGIISYMEVSSTRCHGVLLLKAALNLQQVRPRKAAFAVLCHMIRALFDSVLQPIIDTHQCYGFEFPSTVDEMIHDINGYEYNSPHSL